jgi:hypothetical protein
MNTPAYISILSQPLAFWIANCNAQNIPEIVRCMGLAPVDFPEQLTVFIPEIWSYQFVANLATGKKITFLATSVPTYKSYQYKGEFLSLRACTESEITDQRQYLKVFTDEVARLGLSEPMFYQSYFHQPSLAVTFSVTEVFDQTPYKGTGIQINKKEAAHE